MNVEELKVLITAETKGLKQEVEKVKKMVEKLDKDIEHSTSSINKSFKNMFKGVNFAAMTAGFTMLGKSAIDYASDLQEVQNVVEVAFGSMTDEINKWSKTTLKAFGLNELSSKRMAGRYMAMANGMGIVKENGAVMARTLTQLAGDIASFYNVSVDEAEVALQAVFTGETETLKRYGIVITEVNLQEYARRQGIQKSITKMTQMEKVMLRYNYIMEVTAQAQGDFARTSDNWANQVRVLREQFTQLMGVLGSGFIRVLTPVVKALNEMLATLINITNAMAMAFGGDGIEKTSANVSSSVGDLNDSANGTADGFENANTQAKKLAKTIAGFDELNILNKSTASSGEILGDLSSNLGAGSYGDAVVDEVSYDGNLKKFKDFIEECKTIINKWAENIPKLQLDFDIEKAKGNLESIAKNILNIIAGWGSFVISIAVEVANDLKLGRLANDLLGVVDAAMGVVSTLTDILAPALLDFYENSGLSGIVSKLGDILHQVLNGLETTLNSFATWLQTHRTDIQNVVTELGNWTSGLGDVIEKLSDKAWSGFSTTISGMAQVLNGLDFKEFVNLVATFGAISAAVTGVSMAIKGLSVWMDGGTIKTTSLKNAVRDLAENFKTFVWYYGEFFMARDLVGDASMLSKMEKVVLGLSTAFWKLVDAMKHPIKTMKTLLMAPIELAVNLALKLAEVEGVFGKIKLVVSSVWKLLKAHPFASIVAAIALVIDGFRRLWDESEAFRTYVGGVFAGLGEAFSSMFETLSRVFNNNILPLFKTLLNAFTDTEGGLNKLWDVFSKVVGWMAALMTGTFTTVVVNTFVWLVETIANIIAPIADILNGLIMFIDGIFSGDLGQAADGITKIVKAFFDAIVNIGRNSLNALIRIINQVALGIAGAFNALTESLNKIKIPDWVPKIGGKSLNWGLIQVKQIPYLANGGVITSPTVAMMGEYAGASNNPEIVAPQSILRETIENSNNNVVNALIQQTKQLLGALESMDMSVSIGDDVIAQAAQRGNQAYQRRTGKPLFA